MLCHSLSQHLNTYWPSPTDSPQHKQHPPVSSLCKQVAVGKQLVFTGCSFIVSEWPDTKNVVSRSSMVRALCSPRHRFAREGNAELLMRHYATAGTLAGLFPKKRLPPPFPGRSMVPWSRRCPFTHRPCWSHTDEHSFSWQSNPMFHHLLSLGKRMFSPLILPTNSISCSPDHNSSLYRNSFA